MTAPREVVERFCRFSPFEWSDYAARLMEWFDACAGPYRLTPWERYVQTECRRRFLMYEPHRSKQAAFIDALRAEWKASGGAEPIQPGPANAWLKELPAEPVALAVPEVVIDLRDPRPAVDRGLGSAGMAPTAEKVELLVTVHGPIEASILAGVAAALARRVPGCRAEGVDGETDIVFVRPVDAAPAAVVDLRTAERPLEPVGAPDGPEVAPASPNGSDGLVAGSPTPIAVPRPKRPAPVIVDPSYGEPLTRAIRLRLYLDKLDLVVPDDVEKAKDSHRRGVTWRDHDGTWHCPWCERTGKMAGHVGRHRQGCAFRPGSNADRRMLSDAGRPEGTDDLLEVEAAAG